MRDDNIGNGKEVSRKEREALEEKNQENGESVKRREQEEGSSGREYNYAIKKMET